jgi:hypothetical protein
VHALVFLSGKILPCAESPERRWFSATSKMREHPLWFFYFPDRVHVFTNPFMAISLLFVGRPGGFLSLICTCLEENKQMTLLLF